MRLEFAGKGRLPLIFLLILLAFVMAATAVHFFGRDVLQTKDEPILPLLGFTGLKQMDTALIRTADEYLILQNLYSPLFQSADSGEIEGVLVDSVEWQAHQLIIKMKAGLTTVDGHRIDARDAVFSLKRLMVLQSNTHARLADLFPNCANLKSVDDQCPEVRIIDDLTFSLSPQNERIWLLETLTSEDFAVIPIQSVDPETLKIQDYRNTSGPFFVSEDFGVNGFRLRAHEAHPLFSGRSGFPTSVLFRAMIGPDAENLARSFLEGKFTYYPKYFAPGASELAKISRGAVGPVEVHSTQLSFTRVIRFTKRGMTELSQKERFRIGNAFFESLSSHYRKDGLSIAPLYAFYPESADGALLNEDLAAIKSARGVENLTETMHLEVGCLPGAKALLTPFVQHDRLQLEITEYDDIVANRVAADHSVREPHLYYISTDADPKAALSGVSNVISNLFLHVEKDDADAWLRVFAGEESREKRNEMLRILHQQALETAQLIPLYGFPASSVIRSPWTFSDFPKRIVVDALWLLKPNF